jgi:hypothetical protein
LADKHTHEYLKVALSHLQEFKDEVNNFLTSHIFRSLKKKEITSSPLTPSRV